MTEKIFYSILRKTKNKDEITYEDLLSTFEWQLKRDQIIKRDQSHCTTCGTTPTQRIGKTHFKYYTPEEFNEIDRMLRIKEAEEAERNKDKNIGFILNIKYARPYAYPTDKPVFLHVHHKYYVMGKLPWEYNSDALITLCDTCHLDLHTKNTIKVYTNESLKESLILKPCNKCHGAGYLSEYRHVQGGVCFECFGKKYINFINTNIIL